MFDNPNPQQNNSQGGVPNQNTGGNNAAPAYLRQPSTPITREGVLDKNYAPHAPAYAKDSAGEPEDIFAGTDREPVRQYPKPPQFQPRPAGGEPKQSASIAPIPAPNNAPAVKIKTDKKYIITGVVVIVVLAAILASMIALAYYKTKGRSSIPEIPTLPSQQQNISANQPVSPAGGSVSNPTAVEPAPADSTAASQQDSQEEDKNQPGQYILDEITDSDNDGLTDGEEKRLGTNPEAGDTDGDGLFDREEVRVYKTDPLGIDTDGDGYSDGEEVENGYNPKGEGKLYELP